MTTTGNKQMLTIEHAMRSKSGKTMSVKTSGGKWLQSKDFNIESMIGQTVYADLSQQSFPDGGSITWLNDYTVPGATATQQPPPSAPQQPTTARSAPTPPPAPHGDRDASITAQALCKTVTFSSVQDALDGYWWLYDKLVGGRPVVVPAAENEQTMEREGLLAQQHAQQQADDFADQFEPDQDVPF